MHTPCCKCKIFVLGCKEIHQPNWHLYFSSIKNPSANKCFSSVFVAFFLRRTELLLFIKSKQTAALNHRNTSPQKVFFFSRSKPKSNLKSFVSCELIKLIKSMLAIFSSTDPVAAVSYINCQKSITSCKWWSCCFSLVLMQTLFTTYCRCNASVGFPGWSKLNTDPTENHPQWVLWIIPSDCSLVFVFFF